MEQIRVFHEAMAARERCSVRLAHRHADCRREWIRTGLRQASSLPQCRHNKNEETMDRSPHRATAVA
jgi:hypothetical protein